MDTHTQNAMTHGSCWFCIVHENLRVIEIKIFIAISRNVDIGRRYRLDNIAHYIRRLVVMVGIAEDVDINDVILSLCVPRAEYGGAAPERRADSDIWELDMRRNAVINAVIFCQCMCLQAVIDRRHQNREAKFSCRHFLWPNNLFQ